MKKVILAILAISIISGAVFANGGGKKKDKKAKTENTKAGSDNKKEKKKSNCSRMPGSVCGF